MRYKALALFSLAATSALPSARAQNRPRLHVNTRWRSCSLQLDSSLREPAWRQFTRDAGQLIYFRPLVDAEPMGRGKFDFSIVQWQTNVNDRSSAWNDTFVHPDSMHWLYEGSGLEFPGLALRAGVSSRTDVGVYFTKNFQANYGAWGLQLQQNLLRGARDWDLSVRGSVVSLFGPEDIGMNVVGIDVVTNWRHWRVGPAELVPYADVATFLASSHERSNVVNLPDAHMTGAMGTVGTQLELSVVRVAAEASISRVPSFGMKVGIGR